MGEEYREGAGKRELGPRNRERALVSESAPTIKRPNRRHVRALMLRAYEFFFNARFSTVSRAALVSAYSAGVTAPVSLSLSSEKSSSLSAARRAPFLLAGVAWEVGANGVRDGWAPAVVARGTPGVPVGFRSRNAAAAAKTSASPPRIHHLYLLSGSGVLMGSPMPPPGWPPGCVPACGPPVP